MMEAMTSQAKPSWLTEREITFVDGRRAVWSYDTEGDIVEIFFDRGPASATVDLADGVFLRFDVEQGKALSLGIISATPLLQPGEFGPPLLRLDRLDDLPAPLRQTVLGIITSPPVSYILKVFSYSGPTDADAPIPVAALQPAA